MEELDLQELAYVLWKNKKMILLAAFVGIAIGLLYHSFFVKPLYKGSTSLVLSKPTSTVSTTSTDSITQSDVLLNQKLVSTYGEIIKSRAVAKEVIDELQLPLKEEQLMAKITVNSKKDTELLEISVLYSDPETAAKIANSLAGVFTDKVKEVYNIENVSVIDVAETNNKLYNISLLKVSILASLGCMFFACFILFLTLYFNNTIKSQEDLEKLLGLPVLAVIPKIDN